MADTIKKTSVGGQALIEGLLMIGPRKVAIAIRKPDSEIDLTVKEVAPKSRLQKVPFIRGAVNLFKQMKIGVSALMQSAQYMDIEEAEEAGNAGSEAELGAESVSGPGAGTAADGRAESGSESGAKSCSESGSESGAETGQSKFERFLEEKFGDKTKDVIVYFAVVLSLLFSVGLFILLPNFIAGFIPLDKTARSGLVFLNLCEGLIRVGIFLAYIALSSRLKEIERVWRYHGAEHMTIHCYEHGDPLTAENIRKYSVKHPRCGTSFLFLVMIISIIVFSLVDLASLNLRAELSRVAAVLFSLLVRLVTIPLVAGAAYELIKVTGRFDNALTRIISAPGMLFQRFTTKEPDDSMIEVAIVAFENAVSGDEKEMAW